MASSTNISNGTNGTAHDTNPDPDMDTAAEPQTSASTSYEPGDEEDILLGNVPKITELPGASKHAASYQIEKEDHTLGNSLRYFINKNPDVEFCGYTIPHPSETRMSVRVQTWEDTNTTAADAFRKGLEDMIAACEVVEGKFASARDEFEKTSR